jgi:hypothetical protein
MAAKFKLDLEDDFNYVKQSKEEQAAKTEKKPIVEKKKRVAQKTNIDKVNIDETNIDNMNVYENNKQNINIDKVNIHNIDEQKNSRPRSREPQSVSALREVLLAKMSGQKEIVVKMTEIANEIGFSLSWMQFAMKYLAEHQEFTFARYAAGKTRGMKVTLV